MSAEVGVLTMEDLLESLADQVSHLSYGGDPDDTGQRQIPATEVIQWALAEIAKLRAKVPTDVEQEAMAAAADFCVDSDGVGPWGLAQVARHAATVKGFLERTK